MLTFDKTTYTGVACGTITGAYITVTVGGVPSAGASVTTSLDNGYRFADGSVTNTQPSGSDGRVNLPAISVPPQGGTGTLSATSAGATPAASTASAATVGSAHRYIRDVNPNSSLLQNFPNTPAQTSPVGGVGWLTDDGVLYWGDGVSVATGVAKAIGGIDDRKQYVLEYTLTSDGSAHRYVRNVANGTTLYQDAPDVPAGATPVGGIGWLLPNGDLYWTGIKVATDVFKAVGGIDEQNQYVLEYVLASDGSAHRYVYNIPRQEGFYQAFPSVPAGTTPVGGIGWLTAGGDLYWADDGKVASGVSKAVGGVDEKQQYVLEYTLSSDGSAHRYIKNVTTNTVVYQDYWNIPANCTPVGGIGYLSSTGDLYWAYTGIVASGVSRAVGGIDEFGNYVLEYIDANDGSAHRYVRIIGATPTTVQSFPKAPSGSTPVGGIGYLSPTGDLYWAAEDPVATGVARAIGGRDDKNQYVLEYTLKSDGSAQRYVRNAKTGDTLHQSFPNVPNGTTPVGGIGWLTSTGDLYWSTVGVIASNVAKAIGGIDEQNQYVVEYVLSSDGSAHRYVYNVPRQEGFYQDFPAVPAGTTPVGGIGWLTAGGDLYWADYGKVAAGVSKASGGVDELGRYALEYVLSTDGSAHRYIRNVSTQTDEHQDLPTVPAGSTPVGGNGYLSPFGELYWGNIGRFATGVSGAIGSIDDYGSPVIEYISASACG
ncbi:hypothetical protein [Microbacterium sp. SLBN-111]|uniref:hypothetical protein n=1 Tax=Microbacterium sp. SLBN-111 TaxID=3377733 RepID=UPI003C781174